MEILFENKHWFHIAELAELLNCTERSLKDDLSAIKSSFVDLIFQSSTNGIRIINTDDSDIEMVYHHFFENSTNFSILEYVFFNEGCSSESICQKFFISTSSLYRITNQINKTLRKQYQFEISLNPVKISGNETDIRYFFAQYFSEKYYFFDWPFKDFSPQPLADLLQFVRQETGFQLNFSLLRMLKLLLVVNLYRIKSGHFLQLPEQPKNSDHFTTFLESATFQDIIERFQQEYKIQLDQEVFEQLFISYSQQNFFIQESAFLSQVKTDSYVSHSYQLLKNMMERICQKYHFQIENLDNVIWHLHNTAHLHRQELSSEFVLFDQKGNTLKNFQNIFPNFVSDVQKGIANYLAELQLEQHAMTIHHLAYTFITHSNHLVLNLLQNQPKLKVLVLSNFDQYHAKSIADTLSYYCSNNFELYVWQDMEMSIDCLKDSSYDIIISNFIIPNIENKRIIYSNNINTIELISKLNSMIFIQPEE